MTEWFRNCRNSLSYFTADGRKGPDDIIIVVDDVNVVILGINLGICKPFLKKRKNCSSPAFAFGLFVPVKEYRGKWNESKTHQL